eukprot:3712207-Rhodomonas_salina.1
MKHEEKAKHSHITSGTPNADDIHATSPTSLASRPTHIETAQTEAATVSKYHKNCTRSVLTPCVVPPTPAHKTYVVRQHSATQDSAMHAKSRTSYHSLCCTTGPHSTPPTYHHDPITHTRPHVKSPTHRDAAPPYDTARHDPGPSPGPTRTLLSIAHAPTHTAPPLVANHAYDPPHATAPPHTPSLPCERRGPLRSAPANTATPPTNATASVMYKSSIRLCARTLKRLKIVIGAIHTESHPPPGRGPRSNALRTTTHTNMPTKRFTINTAHNTYHARTKRESSRSTTQPPTTPSDQPSATARNAHHGAAPSSTKQACDRATRGMYTKTQCNPETHSTRKNSPVRAYHMTANSHTRKKGFCRHASGGVLIHVCLQPPRPSARTPNVRKPDPAGDAYPRRSDTYSDVLLEGKACLQTCSPTRRFL